MSMYDAQLMIITGCWFLFMISAKNRDWWITIGATVTFIIDTNLFLFYDFFPSAFEDIECAYLAAYLIACAISILLGTFIFSLLSWSVSTIVADIREYKGEKENKQI